MKTLGLFGMLSILVIFSSSSCKKDPVIPNEEELITTLIYTLTPVGSGEKVIFSFRDLDGDGGALPVISTDTIAVGIQYTGSIQLLNESVSPADNITLEVEDEAESHQFFYRYTAPGPALTINYTDMDPDGFPIGLTTSFMATTAGQGSLIIQLIHLPDKDAPFVSEGLPTNAGGETDIEVAFPIVVQ